MTQTMSEPDADGWITVGPDAEGQDEEMEEEEQVDLEKLMAQSGQSFLLKVFFCQTLRFSLNSVDN